MQYSIVVKGQIVFNTLYAIVNGNGGAKMNRLFATIIVVSAAFLISGTASAEIIKGRVKAIDPESNLFSFLSGKDKVTLAFWDNKTAWIGFSASADMKPDESISVDLISSGDSAVARSVSRIKTPIPAGARLISLKNLVEAVEKGAVTLVDTRAAELYDAGYIPGAVSLPLARLAKSRSGLLPEDKGALIVFYDEGQGGDSAGRGYEVARGAGFSNAAIFAEGVSGWEAQGMVLAASTAYIRKTHPVLLDIRTNEKVAEGHIEGAVNYTVPMIKEYYKRQPVELLTPIVIYGSSDKESVDAAKVVKESGYRRVRFYPGGVSAWSGNAEALVTGSAKGEIPSLAQSHGGRLTGKDFELALLSPITVEIVDVRSEVEQQRAGFPKSKKIPLKSIFKRHGELNPDKIQVLFAADSLRAEMAYDFLKSKGYRLNYLNGTIEFDKNGKQILRGD